MNVLYEALEGVDNLIPRAKITIITKTQIIEDGFPTETEVEIDAFAHIQPLTSFDMQKFTDSTLDSRSNYIFWILDNLVEVLNVINDTKCEIMWGDRKFTIYSKDDWNSNGWIQVIGSERAN